jgi:hypothetical protein
MRKIYESKRELKIMLYKEINYISKDCWYLNLKKGSALSWKCTMRLGILENNRPSHKSVKDFTNTIG